VFPLNENFIGKIYFFTRLKMLSKNIIILFFEAGSLCIVQTDLELIILLPQSPKYWDHREGVGAEGRNDPSLVCTYE
jgi:hypothetical protein